jgi:hypothetical protein
MESESESTPELPILFLTVALVLGLLCRHILKGTRISYTGGLLVLGIAMGAAGAYLWLKKDRKFSGACIDEKFDC